MKIGVIKKSNLKLTVFLLTLYFVFSYRTHCHEAVRGKETTWTNWLGPTYDGQAVQTDLGIPSEGKDFKILWSIDVGKGWASPLVDPTSVYLHDRMNHLERLRKFDKDSAKPIWTFSYDSNYKDNFGMEDGPRSTPALSEEVLVSHGPQGMVHAVSISDGSLIWRVDLVKRFGSLKGFFGRCSSPLILGSKVIIGAGGENTGLVALNLKTGETLWTSTPSHDDYASPVPLNFLSETKIISFMREGLFVLDSDDGKKAFFEPFRSPINASVHAATPLVFDRFVFLSACYDLGAALWQYDESENGQFEMSLKWKKKNVLDCHYSTPVFVDGYIYGFHGRQERGAELRCIEYSTGEIAWSSPLIGSGNLIAVEEKLIALVETGELIVFEANPRSFNTLHRQQILGFDARAHFAFGNNRIYARDKRRLICLSLCDLE